jgi:hypothetical protein
MSVRSAAEMNPSLQGTCDSYVPWELFSDGPNYGVYCLLSPEGVEATQSNIRRQLDCENECFSVDAGSCRVYAEARSEVGCLQVIMGATADSVKP